MWKAVLFLYMASPNLPMPTYEEIVVCTEDTTVEEVKSYLQYYFLYNYIIIIIIIIIIICYICIIMHTRAIWMYIY